MGNAWYTVLSLTLGSKMVNVTYFVTKMPKLMFTLLMSNQNTPQLGIPKSKLFHLYIVVDYVFFKIQEYPKFFKDEAVSISKLL